MKPTHRQRTFRLFVAAMLALALSGCSEIWNEIGGPEPAPKAAAPDPNQPNPDSPEAKIQKYYADQRREKRAEVDPVNSIITCEIDGRMTMTRKFDCQSRGGRIR